VESDSGTNAGTQGAERYRFGDIVVDAVAHTISRSGQAVAVEPKAFSVLLVLLRRAGQLVPRDELLDAVWGHRHITPGVLTRAIAQLRAALDDRTEPHYIQTQHAVGYRFIGVLEPEEAVLATMPRNAGGLVQETMTTVSASPLETAAEGEGMPAPIPVSEQTASPASPYVGNERRGAHRLWRWQWAAFAVVMLALAVWAWREHRPMQALVAEPSIAVLPFTNLSENRDNDYFAEGLAAEMHDALAGVQGLKVAAQVSPATMLRQGGDVKALGALLGVSTVLDASVRREGQRVRINARLSDCTTGYTLWTRSYDRQLSEVFDTQVEIADEAVRSLIDVLPKQSEAMARRLTPTRNAAAFDAYLLGLQQLLVGGEGSEAKAVGFFGRALKADGGFARAQAGICRSEVAAFRHRHDASAFERARDACTHAGKMDAELGEVSVALGDLYQAHGESGKAVEAYTRAESDPVSRPSAYMGLAMVHAEQGDHERALALSRKASALRPADARIFAYSGYYSYLAGRSQEAIAAYRKAVELKPDDAIYWNTLAALYVGVGDNAAGMRALERSIAIEPGSEALTNLGELKYQAGDYAAAVDLHTRATVLAPADYLPWGNLGNALLADPATADKARTAFQQAATLSQRYIATRPADGTALAALSWFLANLGRAGEAREMLARSEQLKGEQAEIALYNAQTFALLGDTEAARARLQAARAAGLPETRIVSNTVLRRAGLVSDNARENAVPSTPGKS
jgi:TolB-like protein/DNA-binding winged helix-turn-helix (wHTH) protein/Flp pilus assembly protein TadD